jgi:ATP-dependent Lon protease
VVKEKAMLKLKEVKQKSEDTGSKAMQFLDGLLKIPFGIYREEPILREMSEMITLFNELIKQIHRSTMHRTSQLNLSFPQKPIYTGIEIYKYLPLLKQKYKPELESYIIASFKTAVATMSKSKIVEWYDSFQHICNTYPDLKCPKYKGKPIGQLRGQLLLDVDNLFKKDDIKESIMTTTTNDPQNILSVLNKSLVSIETKMGSINTFMKNMMETLNRSVYGHTKAKRQIERIIGQWVNGDLTGYCFGFEGPPGVGKTSLAKNGIANCLKDDAGVARPFAFIAMGGSTNSSTLDGHNYTYVGSTWGRIVDILMDTKIMNPIIFIDELDKVSKTENGKEIIGILTHLIDPTQNDSFQDKYFNGINLNLSKALFIFSYNDADLIDKILLDRIHRIKFDHLTNEDKRIISRSFILPDIYKKMGLIDMIEISDEVIEFIIENYTAEPGVRKLKELMFEIVGEINLFTLKNDLLNIEIPLVITIDDIKNKYLKERREMKLMKIHDKPAIGVINGLWANSMGKGGVLPIEASFFPSSTFLDLKLTGMQGDVMKESMTVAKSLAWSLFNKNSEASLKLQTELEKNKNQGLHIHVPEGATPKDGPSAGTAITMVMYSLFTGKQIKNNIAITGEICLQGRVTAIGGLELKILGGIRAGVKTFIYPRDNEKDFTDFMEKYSAKIDTKDIHFVSVETIDEVIPLIFI